MADAQVIIAEDGLEAVLEIPGGLDLSVDEVRELVTREGICFGLDPDGLQDATEVADDPRRVVVARGHPPQTPHAANIVTEAELDEHGSLLVLRDQYLGELQAGSAGSQGLRVDGQPADTALVVYEQGLGPGIRVDGHRAFAAIDGALCKSPDGFWQVVAVADGPRLLDRVALDIDPDGMQARIFLGPGEFAGAQALALAVQTQRIVFGLDKAMLEEAVRPARQPRELPVAVGQQPEAGLDSRLEMLVADQASFTMKADGSLDFRDAHRVKEVQQGQSIARYHGMTAGVPGMDVRGKVLAARPGRDRPITDLIGEGVVVSDEDGQLVVAERGGILCRDHGGRLQVVELYVVDGDLDLKVGNIDTTYPVLVTGDVKEGFVLRSSDDITIDGVLEDTEVHAGGNLLVGSGIVPGEGPIVVGGDLVAPYIRDRQITAGNVIATKSLRYCNIESQDSISSPEIIGGDLLAVHRVIAEKYGDDEGAHHTRVRIGLDPEAMRCEEEARSEKQLLEHQREPLAKEMHDVTFRIRSIQKKMHAGIGINKALLAELLNRSKQLGEEIKLKDEAIRIAEQIAREYESRSLEAAKNAYLRIVGTGHMPVEVQIGKWSHYKAEVDLENVLLRLVQGEVVLFAGGPANEVEWPQIGRSSG